MSVSDDGRTKTPGSVPCRLHLKIARSAPVAIILRRGPFAWVQLLRWDLKTDAIEYGQWFKGRIYEHASDLSDDGELFVYLARKRKVWNWTSANGVGVTWTAVSRPPYFTALALWPHDGYAGGGRFLGPREVALGLSEGFHVPHRDFPPLDLRVRYASGGEASPRSGLDAREEKWVLVDALAGVPPYSRGHDFAGDFLRRTADGKAWLRCLRRPLKQPRRVKRLADHYHLGNAQGEVDLGIADFADFDERGRLLLGQEGVISICDRPWELPLAWKRLADLDSMSPMAVAPPPWASCWPDRTRRRR